MQGTQTGRRTQWWKVDQETAHSVIWEQIAWYDKNQGYISAANLEHMRMYQNANLRGFEGRDYATNDTTSGKRENMTLNVTKSAADTVRAKLCKNKPRPVFLTEGGDWGLQRKAKNLTKFVEGLFYQEGVYEEASQSMLDAAVFGTGIAKVYVDDVFKRIVVERVLPTEIIVDDLEGRYGKPTHLYQVKRVDRAQLQARYPEHAKLLESTKRADDARGVGDGGNSDMVMVIEAWHLPSAPEAKDGRRVVIVDNVTLDAKPWPYQTFPFAIMRWNHKLLGFWGFGLAEELIEINQEINKTVRKIQYAQHRISNPRTYVEKGSKVDKAHLRNEASDIVEYVGTPPIVATPAAVNPEIYAHLDRLWTRAYEIAGISQLSAQGKKPPGLNSGVALREHHEIETERFSQVAQAYEEFVLDIAREAIQCARDIAEGKDSEGFSVKWQGRKFLKTIRWQDVNLADDQYSMKAYPTNFLPSTPAGKLDFTQELMEMGFLGREEAMYLLDYPDLDSVTSLHNAAFEDILATIEELLDNKWAPPTPYQNLELGMRLMLPALNKAKRDGAPDPILDLFRKWLEAASEIQAKAAAGMQPSAAPIGAAMTPAPGLAAAPAGPVPPMGAGPAGAPPMPLPPGV